MNLRKIIQRPSAFVSVAISFAALTIVFVRILIAGIVWQLLMAAQIPITGFFAVRWLPQIPRSALPVLALQVVTVLARARWSKTALLSS